MSRQAIIVDKRLLAIRRCIAMLTLRAIDMPCMHSYKPRQIERCQSQRLLQLLEAG